MKQALKVIVEIKGHYDAIVRSKSPYLKRDREKKIKSLKKELKEYCFYKKLNYERLLMQYNI